MASVDEIKSKLDIVDVVSGYLTLSKAGSAFKARCPFHNERTPSFSVSQDRQMYHCFGCGAGGDMVDFVERIEGVDFYGAMSMLADQAGLSFDKVGGSKESRSQKDCLYEITEAACLYFQSNLNDYPESLSYLAGRGISQASINTWRLGYAPEGWRGLYDHLSKESYSERDMIQAGLVKKASSGRVYDVFRDRIIFPINDPAGRVIAFSGRILRDKEGRFDSKAPKYLNSPDTPIFHKNIVLYGFDKAKQPIRKMNFSTLVEGQVDLVLSHQKGFQNSIATSGTAVTLEHVKRLSRLSGNLMLAFDADSAGVTATKRTSSIALSLGMDVKVTVTPEGQDPADVLVKSPEKWKRILSEAKPVIEFLLDWTLKEAGSDTRKRTRYINKEVLPFIASIKQKSEQSYYVGLVSQKLGIREDAVYADLAGVKPASEEFNNPESDGFTDLPEKEDYQQESQTKKDVISQHIAGLIQLQEAKKEKSLDTKDMRERLSDILTEKDAKTVLENASKDTKLAFKIESFYSQDPPGEKVAEELFRRLNIEILKDQQKNVKKKLAESERSGSDSKIKKYMTKFQDIQQHIDKLQQNGHTT